MGSVWIETTLTALDEPGFVVLCALAQQGRKRSSGTTVRTTRRGVDDALSREPMSLRFPFDGLQSGYETTRKKKFSRLQGTLDAGSVTSMRLDRPTGFAVAKSKGKDIGEDIEDSADDTCSKS